ncbi:hypothetical protein ABID21_004899 [Pseudorhizobium tarimense]|uniref:Uncharacterized protein n=1 Tax=Pseudorhizobium tarimense TaxID=1079109 RepID=A0ABV2HDY7_9HYPH|nr:hypothetical protein [Pseudorhizobium tarimense]MCJ8521721.1 hypothetical protein [Pseudorhizobium tarimense]
MAKFATATTIASQTSREAPGLVETAFVGPPKGANAAVDHYAGAVANPLLLFSAMQSAATLSGILDRIAIVPNGPEMVVYGKFLFLVAQGVIQAGRFSPQRLSSTST